MYELEVAFSEDDTVNISQCGRGASLMWWGFYMFWYNV